MSERAGINTNQVLSSSETELHNNAANFTETANAAVIEEFRKEMSAYEYTNPNLQSAPVITVKLSITPTLEIQAEREARQYYLNPDRQYDIVFERKLLAYMMAVEKASSLYSSLNITSSGMNPEYSRVFAILRNSNSNDLSLISELYKEQYKRDFSLDLRYSMKSQESLLNHMDILLKGDKTSSYSSEIRLALRDSHKSASDLKQILQELDAAGLDLVRTALKTKYGIELEHEIQRKFKSPELDLLKIELIKDPILKQVQIINELIRTSSTNPEPLIQFLRELSPANIEAIKNHKINLETVTDPVLKEILRLQLDGNRPLAEAFYINKELKNTPPDIFRLEQSISSLNDSQRKVLQESYLSKFGKNLDSDFSAVFKNAVIEKSAAGQLLESGKIEDSTKIYLLSREMQKNNSLTDGLIKLLENKSCNEMSQIKSDIARMHQTSLDTILADTLKGREQIRTQLDARLALYGKPETFEDELSKVKAKYEFERIHLPLKLERVIDTLLKKAKRVDLDLEELEQQHKKLLDKKELISEEEEIKFYNKLNFLEKSLKDYEKTKKLYNTTIENLIGACAALTFFIIANDFNCPAVLSLILCTSLFFLGKHVSRSYIKESLAIEKSLSSFKERQRNRKKSYFSKRIPGKRI